MARAKKVGGQIKGGSTNLGRLGRAGTTAKVGTGASKKRLGSSAMTNRNVAKLGSQSSKHLRTKAYS